MQCNWFMFTLSAHYRVSPQFLHIKNKIYKSIVHILIMQLTHVYAQRSLWRFIPIFTYKIQHKSKIFQKTHQNYPFLSQSNFIIAQKYKTLSKLSTYLQSNSLMFTLNANYRFLPSFHI